MSETLAAAQKRVTNDTLKVEGALDTASAALKLSADQNDDAGDSWKLVVADGGALELGNDKSIKDTYNPALTISATTATAISGVKYVHTGTKFLKASHGLVKGDTVVLVTDSATNPVVNGSFVVGQLYYVKERVDADNFTLGATVGALSAVAGAVGDSAADIVFNKVSNNTVLGTGGDTAILGKQLSFYGVTPVAQRANANQVELDTTTNTVGTAIANKQLVDVGATNTGDVSGVIKNNFATIAASVNEIRTVLVNLGLMKGSA